MPQSNLQTVQAIERNLHELIRSRAARFIDKYPLPMPSLCAMLAGEASTYFSPTADPGVWFFRVPGMYGGFRCRWIGEGEDTKLEVVSFCRVVGSSGRRHEVTTDGSVLVETGFM